MDCVWQTQSGSDWETCLETIIICAVACSAVIVHNRHTPALNKHLLVFKCFLVYLDGTSAVVSDLCSAFPPAQLQSVGLLLVSTGSLWFTCCLSLFNVFHLYDNSPETHSKTDLTPNKTRVSREARNSPSRYQESLSHHEHVRRQTRLWMTCNVFQLNQTKLRYY